MSRPAVAAVATVLAILLLAGGYWMRIPQRGAESFGIMQAGFIHQGQMCQVREPCCKSWTLTRSKCKKWSYCYKNCRAR